MPHDRLPNAVSVRVLANERPGIGAPGHGLKMQDSAISTLVLEMQEPVLAVRAFHPCTLMGTVDGAGSPGHHYLLLIRAEGILCPQDCLPACGNASGRREDVIVTVSLIELCTLNCGLGTVAVVDYA